MLRSWTWLSQLASDEARLANSDSSVQTVSSIGSRAGTGRYLDICLGRLGSCWTHRHVSTSYERETLMFALTIIHRVDN